MERAPLPNYSPPRTTTHGGTRPPGVTCPNLRPQYDPCACVPNSLAITPRDHYHDHDGDGRESRTLSHASFRTSTLRVQNPEATLRLRAPGHAPFYIYGRTSARSESRKQNQRQPASDDEIPRPARSSRHPATSSSLLSTPLAQRTSSRLSSRLNDFWWRSELDVRGPASAKCESSMATKMLMVRVGGGRCDMVAETPDENERTCW